MIKLAGTLWGGVILIVALHATRASEMARGSLFIAVLAILLSLLLHGLGLSLSTSKDQPSSTEEAASDVTDVGGAFEDLAETSAEPTQPEPALPPDPPSVTPPEQPIVETLTSQALVASDNPQNVIAPDTGTVEVTKPDAAEPSQSEPPAPEPTEQSEDAEEGPADAAISQPVEPGTEAEVADEAAAEVADGAPLSVTETVSPVVPTPAIIPETWRATCALWGPLAWSS